MTYLQFLLFFILPPLLLLAASSGAHLRRLGPRALAALLALAGVALAYTAAWDNYLIYRGVWMYGTGRVLGTVGYVPVEEYLFIMLQPLLTGLWLVRGMSGQPRPAAARGRAGAAGYLALAAAGAALLTTERGTYLGLILAWAAPVLAVQSWLGSGALAAERGALVRGVLWPTLYLWAADALAIHLGIWRISTRHTLGPHLGPLPLEEAVFFLVTNLLVARGIVLAVRRAH